MKFQIHFNEYLHKHFLDVDDYGGVVEGCHNFIVKYRKSELLGTV